MKIGKIFNNNPVSKVNISKRIPEKEYEILTRAKGVMDNYLKDKNFNVTIDQASKVWGKDACDYLEIAAYQPKAISVYHIKKNSETPFLRLIYQTLELFAKDKIFQAK